MRRGYLPIGTKGNIEFVSAKRGDIFESRSGEKFIFIEAKIVRWAGKGVTDGKQYGIPFYSDRMQTTPFCVKQVGHEKSMDIPTGSKVKMAFGQLFSLPQKKETFMYIGDTTKRGGKRMIKAVDIASGKGWNIGLECSINKIDINKIKKESKA